MKLEVSNEFINLLPTSSNVFNQILGIKGKVYRQLEARETLRFTQGGKHFFIKKHFGVGWREIFKNLSQFKLPVIGAENEMLALKKLNLAGVLTPEVIAYGQKGWSPASSTSFVVTRALDDCISLEDFCRDWHRNPPDPAVKSELIKRVATVARVMHQLGINHRDFYICHFLWQRNTDKLFLIDLHRAQIRKKVPARWLAKDLAGLYFSAMDIGLSKDDLIWFLENYFELPFAKILEDKRDLLKEVEEKAHSLYKKEFSKQSLMPRCFG